jgi:hypothetical protein
MQNHYIKLALLASINFACTWWCVADSNWSVNALHLFGDCTATEIVTSGYAFYTFIYLFVIYLTMLSVAQTIWCWMIE